MKNQMHHTSMEHMKIGTPRSPQTRFRGDKIEFAANEAHPARAGLCSISTGMLPERGKSNELEPSTAASFNSIWDVAHSNEIVIQLEIATALRSCQTLLRRGTRVWSSTCCTADVTVHRVVHRKWGPVWAINFLV